MNVPLPRLYGVTDETVLPSDILVERIRTAVEAGLELIQVRFKTTKARERLWLGRALRVITAEEDALLIINDDPELALALSADGVHVGAEDASVERAREVLGPDAIVGMSAYGDPELVAKSRMLGATYIGLSSPWPSPTKDKPSTTLEQFRELAATSPVPAYAIGGVRSDQAAELVRLGCHGVAAVSSLFGTGDVAAATHEFLRELG